MAKQWLGVGWQLTLAHAIDRHPTTVNRWNVSADVSQERREAVRTGRARRVGTLDWPDVPILIVHMIDVARKRGHKLPERFRRERKPRSRAPAKRFS
jgi:hypothetical protein